MNGFNGHSPVKIVGRNCSRREVNCPSIPFPWNGADVDREDLGKSYFTLVFGKSRIPTSILAARYQ